jgi:hypothetical protein
MRDFLDDKSCFLYNEIWNPYSYEAGSCHKKETGLGTKSHPTKESSVIAHWYLNPVSYSIGSREKEIELGTQTLHRKQSSIIAHWYPESKYR